jgi:cation transport protein ChaC
MEYLYDREMGTAVYIPRWGPVETELGVVRAATFVVDHGHHQYAGHLTMEEMVEFVTQGQGVQGRCGEYLAHTVHHLEALGLNDRPLRQLLNEVEKRCAGSSKL